MRTHYSMDSSNALDYFTNRRDLLNGFLLEYSLLFDEQPELTDLFSFEAYVQFSFSHYVAGEQRQEHEHLLREIKRLRDQLPTLPSLRYR